MCTTLGSGPYRLMIAAGCVVICLAGGEAVLAATDGQPVAGGAAVLRIYDGKQPDKFLGLGFVVDSRGHALAALHSVASSESLRVLVAGEGAEEGHDTIQVASDRELDVAILKVKREGLKRFLLAAGTELALSASVQTMAGLSGAGHERGTSPMGGVVKDKVWLDSGALVLETDMVCAGGVDGGPLLDDAGHVVGICGVKPMGFAARGPVIQALSIDALKLFLRQNGVRYGEPGPGVWGKVMWIALAIAGGIGLYVGAYYVQGRILELQRSLSDRESWIALLTSMTLHIGLIALVAVILWVRSKPDLDSIQTGASVEVVRVRSSSAADADAGGGEQAPTKPTVEFDPLKPTTPIAQPQPANVQKMSEEATQKQIDDMVGKAGGKAKALQAEQDAKAAAALAGAVSPNIPPEKADDLGKKLDARRAEIAKGQQGVPEATQRRRARWHLLYEKNDMPRAIDRYGGELALCLPGDSLVYVTNVSGTPRKRLGSISSDSRMFWLPTDGSTFGCGEQEIFRRAGYDCPPGSQVVLFFPASFEQKLMDLERAWWIDKRRPYDEDKIQQTIFRVEPGSLTLSVTSSH